MKTSNRTELERLSNAIFTELDPLTYVEAGFVFRSHLDDFVWGANYLLDILEAMPDDRLTELRNADNSSVIHPELKPTLRRLCELSREATFAADPVRLPESLRSNIESLFQFVVLVTPELEDEQARDFRENISERTMQPIPVS